MRLLVHYTPICPPLKIPLLLLNRRGILLPSTKASTIPIHVLFSRRDGKFLSSRFLPKSERQFRFIQSYLINNKVSFHTYALLDEREVKVALEGGSFVTSCDLIKEDSWVEAISVSPLQTGCKQPVSSFLITLRKVGHFSDTYDLILLCTSWVHVRCFNLPDVWASFSTIPQTSSLRALCRAD